MTEEEILTMLEPFMPFELSHNTFNGTYGKNTHHTYNIMVVGTDLDYEIKKESFELLKPYASAIYEEGKLVK